MNALFTWAREHGQAHLLPNQDEMAEENANAETAVFVWPENVIPLILFIKCAPRWNWVSTGMGVIRMGLNWYDVEHVVLRQPPMVYDRPKLKKKKRRNVYMAQLEQMEQAAMAVFMEEESRKNKEREKEKNMKCIINISP